MIEVDLLKKGDKIRRTKDCNSLFSFTLHGVYEVLEDERGAVYIRQDDGTSYGAGRLRANVNYWEHVDPTKEEVGFVRIVNTTWNTSEATEVTVLVDDKGLEAIKELEAKSLKEEEARGLDAQIAQLEGKLKALKAERKTMN